MDDERSTAAPMNEEPVRFKMVTKLTLAKFDGDPPAEGEDKAPVEVIEIVDEDFPKE